MGIATNDDINALIKRVKRFAERNGAGSFVSLRRCIGHLGRAINAGSASQTISLLLAQQQFNVLTAAIRERRGAIT
jgi:hypothetical protein